MRERTLEMKLVKETRKRGGVALKFVSPSFSGMPDRIGPFAPSGDEICGSEGPGGEAKAAAKKPAYHASRNGIT